MTITATSTCIPVTLTDAQGEETGQTVSVFLDYAVTVESHYGEDADGHRGVPLVEYDVLDAYLDANDIKQLTAAQSARAITEAVAIFHQRQKHF